MTKRATTPSSGNVFADLGLAGAADLNLKAELAIKLREIMRRRGLSQTAAARITGVSQPDLSRLLRGRLRDLSVERLLRALGSLETEIDISVRFNGEPVGEPIHLQVIPAAAA